MLYMGTGILKKRLSIQKRLREAGMKVIGIGEKKTLIPFITACDKFIYIEILKIDEPVPDEERKTRSSKKRGSPKSTPIDKIGQELVKLVKDSITDLGDENGWAYLGNLGTQILKKKPDFDSRNYGYPKMLPLIKSLNKFEFDERESGKGNIKHVYVKIR